MDNRFTDKAMNIWQNYESHLLAFDNLDNNAEDGGQLGQDPADENADNNYFLCKIINLLERA